MCRPVRIQQLRDSVAMLLAAVGAHHLYDVGLRIRDYFKHWCDHPLPFDTKIL